MITYLKRDQVDIIKYDACIANASQSRVYAYSWYLDCIAKNWDVLVLDDYAAVMPLPRRKKYGINYIFQPPWVQQLGIFSKKNISDKQYAVFVKNIPQQFKLIDFNVNSSKGFDIKLLKPRANYILALNSDYKLLFKSFSKGWKNSITQAIKIGVLVKEENESLQIIDLFRTHKGLNLQLREDAYLDLERLTQKAEQLNKLKIYCAYSSQKRLIGGAIFIISDQRITYLFSAINEDGRRLQAMSLILNTVIKNYSESDFIFDFEGSTISSIAAFFKSFGAQQETYYHFKKWRLF